MERTDLIKALREVKKDLYLMYKEGYDQYVIETFCDALIEKLKPKE